MKLMLPEVSPWLRRCTVFVVCSSLVPLAQGLAAQPDLTGVWTSHRIDGENVFRRGNIELPLTEEGREKAEAYRELIGDSGVTPGQMCLGSGMPGSMLGSGAYPMEIIQRPEQITVIYEAHSELRRIFMGEGVFPEEEMFADRNGYSEGRWEGDTLVVETVSLKEQADQTYVHSDQAKIVERYTFREEDGTDVLTVEMTMEDPVFYTEPVTVTKAWARVDGGRLLPYECNEPAWHEYLDSLKAVQR